MWSSDWQAVFISVRSLVPFLAQRIKYLSFIVVLLSRSLPCWDNSLLWQFVPWLRLLVTSQSMRRTELETGSVHAQFVVHRATMGKLFLPVLQFSPVSIIPPLLHTHSSIYHPHCIMFLSQYYSFPLSVSFHHCSTLIHSSTTQIV